MYYRLIALSICSILILACGFALCAPAKPEPPKPIPRGPECYTQAKYDATEQKLHYRTVVEAYRKVGVHDLKWDDKAVSFLEGFLKHRAKSADAPTADELFGQGKELMDSGCTDPVVQYAYAIACRLKREFSKMDASLCKAMDGFEKGRYLKVQARLAPYELLRFHKAWRIDKPEDSKTLELLRKWNIEMLTDGSFLPGEERIALSFLYGSLDALRYPGPLDLYEAIKQIPGLDPYIVGVVGGRCYIGQGWEERGRGWAVDVAEEGWKGFEENMRTAYRLLMAAWKLHPEYPEAPTYLITVATAGHTAPGETTRLWFDRAVAAQMDHYPAYSQYIWSIYPRWGGSHDEMYDFGVECLKTGRFDTNVPWLFFENIGRIVSDYDSEPAYWRRPDTTEHIKQMCDGYEKTGNIGSPERCKTIKAVLLYANGSCEEAKGILDELGEKADKTVPPEFIRMPLEQVREEVDVLSTQPGKGLVRAASLYDEGEIQKALVVCREVLGKYPDKDKIPSVVRRWSSVLNIENGLLKSEWVDLSPHGELSGWRVDNGEWIAESDGSIKGSASNDGAGMTLTSHANLGGHFEVKGELDFVSPADSAFFAVLEFRGSWRTMDVMFNRTNKEVRISSSTSSWKHSVPSPPIVDHNTFTIRYWDGKVTVEVNGEPLPGCYAGKPGSPEMSGESPDERVFVAITASAFKGKGVVRVKNLQARRLKDLPKEMEKVSDAGKPM